MSPLLIGLLRCKVLQHAVTVSEGTVSKSQLHSFPEFNGSLFDVFWRREGWKSRGTGPEHATAAPLGLDAAGARGRGLGQGESGDSLVTCEKGMSHLAVVVKTNGINVPFSHRLKGTPNEPTLFPTN